jgi:hypothetical protein
MQVLSRAQLSRMSMHTRRQSWPSSPKSCATDNADAACAQCNSGRGSILFINRWPDDVLCVYNTCIDIGFEVMLFGW